MKLNKKLITLSVVVTIALSGCGGSSTSTTENTAYYIDNAVSGLKCTSGTTTTTTDSSGAFTYEDGKTTSCKVGGITLPTIPVMTSSAPYYQLQDTKSAMLLHSLDHDNDSSNGISIDPKVIDAINKKGTTSVPTNSSSLADLVQYVGIAVGSDFRGQVKDETAINKHLATQAILTDKLNSDTKANLDALGNDLFNQPDNDDTCGIRQVLFCKDVLNKNYSYRGDILPVWTQMRTAQLTNYSASSLPANFSYDVPTVYTHTAVLAVNGGPESLPSSVVEIAPSLGLKLVNLYVDKSAVQTMFPMVDTEITLIDKFASVTTKSYSVSSNVSEVITNPNSYYMIVINNGTHWIGATTTTIYNSLNAHKQPYDEKYLNSVEFGVIMEFQKK
ncbi:MAG: hypothetical protein GQ570_10780 [Helicobacteraceae bacterium]|nr:hypothetical protein [Helicobacteraceae bacterium]